MTSTKLTGYLSLRSLPPYLEQKILTEAKHHHTSKSRIVIDALQEIFKLQPSKKRRPKVRHFFGHMNQEDLRALEKSFKEQRSIDWEMWK